MLYIAGSDRSRLQDFLAAVKGPVLTVGEANDFLRQGGAIQFITERTVRLRINLRSAREVRLTISSQLLRLAEIENR
jgi:hypothetical protein